MIKKIAALVITTSLFSAGLLYLGITLIEQYTPALASSQDALVARSNAHGSAGIIPAVKIVPLTAEQGAGSKKLEVPLTVDPSSGEKKQEASLVVKPGGEVEKSAEGKVVSAVPAGSNQSQQAPDKLITTNAPAASITIAELLKNPGQYLHQVFTITGLATSLGNDKLLLNDGTGQILVEVDDDMVGSALLNALSITVLGKLDDSSSQSTFELDACTLTYNNQNVIIDDCKDDDTDTPGDDDVITGDDPDDVEDDADEVEEDADDVEDDMDDDGETGDSEDGDDISEDDDDSDDDEDGSGVDVEEDDDSEEEDDDASENDDSEDDGETGDSETDSDD